MRHTLCLVGIIPLVDKVQPFHGELVFPLLVSLVQLLRQFSRSMINPASDMRTMSLRGHARPHYSRTPTWRQIEHLALE
jgi:hypothetical protein